jgi:hypothetical protein
MKTLFIFLFMVSLLATLAKTVSAEDCLCFNNYCLGSSISEIENNKEFDCGPKSYLKKGEIQCKDSFTKETIAGIPAKSLSLYYKMDTLTTIAIYINEDDFERVVSALSEKYGEAGIGKSFVSNKVGETFENIRYTWKKKKGVIKAERYVVNLKTSIIVYSDEI